MVEMLDQAHQIAMTVSVAVGERPRVDLIQDGRSPPGRPGRVAVRARGWLAHRRAWLATPRDDLAPRAHRSFPLPPSPSRSPPPPPPPAQPPAARPTSRATRRRDAGRSVRTCTT